MPRKFTFNHVVIVLVWLSWIAISIVFLTSEKVDKSMLLTKYGQTKVASCNGIKPKVGIDFEVKYQGEENYTSDFVALLCSQDNTDKLSYSEIKVIYYKKAIYGLFVNGDEIMSVDKKLDLKSNSNIPFHTFFLCLIITWLMILKGRPLKNK